MGSKRNAKRKLNKNVIPIIGNKKEDMDSPCLICCKLDMVRRGNKLECSCRVGHPLHKPQCPGHEQGTKTGLSRPT